MTRQSEELEGIKAALDADAARALQWLFPNGRLVRREFQVADISGSAGSSLRFNVHKLTGKDFSGTGRGFKGVFSVFAAHAGDFLGGLALARQYAGLSEAERPQVQKGKAKGRKGGDDAWTQIIPAPFGVARPDFARLWPSATFRQAWDYRDAAGRLLFFVGRYEWEEIGEDGERTIRKATPVISFGHGEDGRRYWRAKGNGRDILFGLEQLAARPDAPVLVVEGEKSAVAARLLFPKWVVLAWKGGSGNAGNIDVSPLAGRNVALWPDADSAGIAAMGKISKAALKSGADVRLVVLPAGLPDGWDLADDLPDGWTRDTLEGLLTSAELRGLRRRLPAYYPAPAEPRDRALKRQRGTIAEWFEVSAKLSHARKIAAERAAGLISAAGLHDPDLRETLSERQIAARKAVISRKVNREVAAEHGLKRITGKGKRLLVTGAQGSGKSAAAAEETASLDAAAGLVVWWTVPTIEKAEEQAAEYRSKYARPGSPPVLVVRGRSQDDPQRPGKAMCPRHKVVNRAAAHGVEVRKKICKVCPLKEQCGSVKQDAKIASMNGGLFVMAREYTFLPSPAPAPDMFIGDESLVAIAAAEPAEISTQQIAGTGNWKAAGLDAAVETSIVLGKVKDAAERHPTRMLAALRDAEIDSKQVGAAISYLNAATERAAAETISGKMSDAEIADALDAVEENDIPKVIRLLRQIRREWDTGRAGLNSVVARDGIVTVFGMLTPRISADTPILLLDGTGSAKLNRIVFGELEHAHIPVDRQAHVTGTKGKTKPKTYSRQSITGRMARTKADREAGQEGKEIRPAEADRLRQDIAAVVRRQDGPVFVCATMGVEEALSPILPGNALSSHFAAVRGKNLWEGCMTAVVVGREQVAPQRLEDMTRPFTSTDAEPFQAFGCYVKQTRGRRMRDGTVQPVEVEVHPDPRCQEILEQLREAEIIQAADRVRPIFNERSIVLMNELVLDLTYDRTMTHEELVMGGNRFERAWKEKGILPMGARDLRHLFRGLWDTEKAAERDLEKAAFNTPGNQMIITIWFRGVLTQYRVKGQRGPRPSSAWIDLSRHPDPKAALEAEVGPVTEFRIIHAEKPAEIRLEAQAVAMPAVELGRPVLVVSNDPPAEDLSRLHAILAQGSRLADLSSRLDRFKPPIPVPIPRRVAL